MNARIGKLIEQAEEWVCENYPAALDDNDEFHAQTMEKFADLIVKECNEVLRLVPYNSNVEFGDEVIYQDAIKVHFGIK